MRGRPTEALGLLVVAAACAPMGGGYDASFEADPESLPPAITTAQLAGAFVDTPYGHRVRARGGKGPYSWSLVAPSWLTIDPGTGELRGLPPSTAGAQNAVSLRVTDSVGRSSVRDLVLPVSGCFAGAWRGCLLPSGGQCLVGEEVCLPDGTWTGCDAGVANTSASGCGPACSTCGPEADRCASGAQCACGSGSTCGGGAACCTSVDGGAACRDLLADPLACGACGAACLVPPHTVPTCDGGVCGAVCQLGWTACDGRAADSNGCEADLQADPSHCGTCPNACPTSSTGTPICIAGGCDLACNPGTPQHCGVGDCRAIDVLNCGGCNVPCANPGAQAGPPLGCAMLNKCVYQCSAGYADCNGGTDGCERPINFDPYNCGNCNVNCFLQGKIDCVAGQCV